jgi:hypothetical protein
MTKAFECDRCYKLFRDEPFLLTVRDPAGKPDFYMEICQKCRNEIYHPIRARDMSLSVIQRVIEEEEKKTSSD